MKIERGILGTNSSNEVIVCSPMNIYKISMESLLEREFRSSEKLLGVVINAIFHRCECFVLNNDKKVFGYIVKNNLVSSVLTIQVIKNFDITHFDPYNSDYPLGDQITVIKNEINNY